MTDDKAKRRQELINELKSQPPPFASPGNLGSKGLEQRLRPAGHYQPSAGRIGRPLKAHQSSLVPELIVLGGSGDFDIRVGDAVSLSFEAPMISLRGPTADSSETFPVSDVEELSIFGPGAETSNLGVWGGGFGFEAAAKGMLAAAAINKLTEKTEISTLFLISTTFGEAFFCSGQWTPEAARLELSPLLWQIRRGAAPK